MQDNQKKLFIKALASLATGLNKDKGKHRIYKPDQNEYGSPEKKNDEPHYHESWELKIPAQGALRCRFARQCVDTKSCAAILIAPHTFHCKTTPADLRENTVWLNCLFENGDIRLMLTKGRRLTHYFFSSDQKSKLTSLLGKPADEFCEHIALMLESMGKQTGQEMAGKWLAIFFSALREAIGSPPLSSPQQEIVSRTIALLNNMSSDSTLTVARMARILNISPKYLSSVFHRLTGVSPRQKLIRIRLERAFRLLQTGRFSVKEVAALAGWQNQFYFSNSFRRHYGMAPSQVPARADEGLQASPGTGIRGTQEKK